MAILVNQDDINDWNDYKQLSKLEINVDPRKYILNHEKNTDLYKNNFNSRNPRKNYYLLNPRTRSHATHVSKVKIRPT